MVMVVVVLKSREGRALVLSLSSRPHHFEGASSPPIKPGSGCPSPSLFVGGSPAPYPFHQSLSAPTLTYPPRLLCYFFGPVPQFIASFCPPAKLLQSQCPRVGSKAYK